VERLRPGAADPGDIVDLSGRVIGRHDGIIHFTVGQRRGLGIAAGHPLYVVRLDAATRRVIVGPREALRRSRMQLRDVNWIGEGTIDQTLADQGREIYVKVRSTRPPQPAWLRGSAAAVEVELAGGEDGVSPGQACVFYDAPDGQSRVLGGGFIHNVVDPARPRPAPQRRSLYPIPAAMSRLAGWLLKWATKYFITMPWHRLLRCRVGPTWRGRIVRPRARPVCRRAHED
jgi:tRNA-specific 2-thiouridylase